MRIERYEIELTLDPPARSFKGVETVRLEVDEPWIRFHAVELAISDASVDGKGVQPEVDAAGQEVRLPAPGPGARTAHLEFSGRILPDGLTGMYVSPFGSGGEILTTQMYPTGARRLFPCFDAPAQKAEFHLTVRAPRGARVIFNTDPEEIEDDGPTRRIRFRPTPRMSSYLLYLGIGPFEETERSTPRLRTIVAHPPGRAAAAAYALDHAARFVQEYEAYYALPYPLPKLHLVAVPSFWAGAMENWGAIAFRETTLLVDAQTATHARRWNRQVLCHEIAHQWFGNLVTNAWWNDFWLNEAFATFVAARIVDRVHPGEATWADFVQYETGRGLSQDALESAHPVEVPIARPEEIGEIADGITYGKGASLLRMIEAYLGEPAFRRGVTAYLTEHQYGAATGADLWAALDRHSGEPVSRIMNAWIGQPGHPIVEVRRQGGELVLSQRKFRYDGKAEPSVWPTPVEVEVDGVRHRTILEKDAFRIPGPAPGPIRVNPDRTGFFHVRYAGALSAEMAERWGELTELDQWGLLVDRAFFLNSGDGTLEEYLAVVDRAAESDAYLPALTAARQLHGYAPFLPRVPALRASHRRFFERQFERLGPNRRPEEPASTGVLRGDVAFGLLDSSPGRTEALARAFADSEETVDRDLLIASSAAFVQCGGADAWDQLRARIPNALSDEEAKRLATSLPFTPDPDRFGATLRLLEGPELSASRIWDVLVVARVNWRHAEPLWAWFEGALPMLAERWRGTPLLSLLLAQTLGWVGLGRGDRVRGYWADHHFPEADRGVREGLERLALREVLAKRLGAAETARPAE